METVNDLHDAIELQNRYAPYKGAHALVKNLGFARDSVLAFLSAPLPCHHCGFVGRGHVHTMAPIIDAAFIAKYPCN